MPNIELIGANTYNTVAPICGTKAFKKGVVYPATQAEWEQLAGELNPGNGATMFALSDREVGSIDPAIAGLNRGDMKAAEVRLTNPAETDNADAQRPQRQLTQEEADELGVNLDGTPKSDDQGSGDGQGELGQGDGTQGSQEGTQEGAGDSESSEGTQDSDKSAEGAQEAAKPKTLVIGGKRSAGKNTPPAPAPDKAEEV